MKQEYTLPIKVTIEADMPNKVIEEIAKAIYDATHTIVHSDGFDSRVKFFDMDYSIYQKMNDDDFAT